MVDPEEDFGKAISLEEQEHGEEEALTCDEVVDPTEAQHAVHVEKVQESDHAGIDSSSLGTASKAQEAAAKGSDLEEKERSHQQEEALKDSEVEDKKKGTHKD